MSTDVDTIEPATEAARNDSAGFFFINSMIGNLLEAEWVDQDKLNVALDEIGAAIDEFLVELNNAMDNIGGGQLRMGNEDIAVASENAVSIDPESGEPVVESRVDPAAPAPEQQVAMNTTAPTPTNEFA